MITNKIPGKISQTPAKPGVYLLKGQDERILYIGKAKNLKNRLKEVDVAKQIIDSDADEFYDWYEGLEVIPLIVGIQDKFNKIRREELDKYKRRKLKHIKDEDFKIIEEMTSQIMSKTLHNPIMYLKGYQLGEKSKKTHLKESVKLIEDIFFK